MKKQREGTPLSFPRLHTKIRVACEKVGAMTVFMGIVKRQRAGLYRRLLLSQAVGIPLGALKIVKDDS